MGLQDFEGGKKYKVMMLAVLIFILVGCIVGPFINYDLYLTAFLFLTGGSLLQLLLFAIASIRTTRDSLQVLDRVSTGRHHVLEGRPPILHAIVLPIYLEPTEVVVQALHFLSGHQKAKTDYLLFLALEARTKDVQQKAEQLKSSFAGCFRTFECTFHELKPGEYPGKASNLNHCLSQMIPFFQREKIDRDMVMFSSIDSDNWIPEAYFQQMELVMSQNRWNLHDFMFGANQLYNIDAEHVPMLSRGADFNMALLVYMWRGTMIHCQPIMSNYSLSYTTFQKMGFFQNHPDFISDDLLLSVKSLWKTQGKIKIIELPLAANMCSCSTGQGYWADLRARFWQAERHMRSLYVNSYNLNMLFKNPFRWQTFIATIVYLETFLLINGGMLASLIHIVVKIFTRREFSCGQLILYIGSYLLVLLISGLYSWVADRSARVLFKQKGASIRSFVQNLFLIYILAGVFIVVPLLVATVKGPFVESTFQTALKQSRKKSKQV